MRYYKLTMDMTRENDVVLHCKNSSEIGLNTFVTGEYYSGIANIIFYYDEIEGNVWTDYLANDKGWFIVSERFKDLLDKMNSDIQFIGIGICNIEGEFIENKYYIANIVKVVDVHNSDKRYACTA